MPKILITGITGFLGSSIALSLIKSDYEVIGLKRSTSNTWRVNEVLNNIQWVNIDGENEFKTEIISKNIDVIVHCAWIGVSAEDRENWIEQSKNVILFSDLLEIAKLAKIRKFVFLGSQAEYGVLSQVVDEDWPTNPTSAYGAVKLACLEMLKVFSKSNEMDWIWARIFSIFGEKEDKTWLIPSLIYKMQHSVDMDFSAGRQRYAYLYIEDFAAIMNQVINRNIESGIYNISKESSISLMEMITRIRNLVSIKFKLNFGALPYRENQSMHIEGDISKLKAQIGTVIFTDDDLALQNIVDYYKNN